MNTAVTPVRLQQLAYPAAVVALAVVCSGLIWLPYYGDQALFAVIGRDVLAGRPLYSGIWDIKQPGIFVWYGLVGAVAGPSAVVTRALDVAIAVLTAVLIGRLVRDRTPGRSLRGIPGAAGVSPDVPLTPINSPVIAASGTVWTGTQPGRADRRDHPAARSDYPAARSEHSAARWTPVAATAVLLLPVRALDLGQIEQLAVLPMTAALLLVMTPGRARAVAAGVAIGVVAVLKLWVAAVPLVAVAVWLLAQRRRPDLVAVLAGAAVPVLAVLAWLAGTGALGAALDTWFAGPGQLLDQPGVRPVSRLVSGLGRYVLLTAPVLVLAGWRLASLLRRPRDPLNLALAAWVVTGLAVIGGQLWWSYHWILLTPALVALAARQVGDVGRRGAVLLAVAALPLLAVGVASPERPMVHGNGVTAQSRAAIDEALGSGPAARAELAAAGVAPGTSLYVLGDPTYQLVAAVPYPARLNGWAPESFTDAQWDELGADLARTRPSVVFLENIYADLATVRGGALLRLLADHYVRVRTSDAGVWYRITEPMRNT